MIHTFILLYSNNTAANRYHIIIIIIILFRDGTSCFFKNNFQVDTTTVHNILQIGYIYCSLRNNRCSSRRFNTMLLLRRAFFTPSHYVRSIILYIYNIATQPLTTGHIMIVIKYFSVNCIIELI